MGRKPLIAGNWKMFGRRADLAEIAAVGRALGAGAGVEVAICPPATLLAAATALGDLGEVRLGGQDCAAVEKDGAHTGDVNAAMIADAGATYCIIGHSERRADHKESDALVRAKAGAVQAAGLSPILCVGESLADREAGRAVQVVASQLEASMPDSGASLVIAYEPVWAIGTGRVPGTDDIRDMHGAIRDVLTQRFGADAAAMRILYGGSVKPANAAEIFAVPGVDGALVGGASLKAADFLQIIRAHPAAERR